MMNYLDTRILAGNPSETDELTPERSGRMQQLRRRLAWQRWVAALVRPVALPAVMLLALAATVSVPLPAKAAQLGSGWSTRVYAGTSIVSTGASTVGAGKAIAWRDLASMRIAFSGQLAPAARRTTVTLVLQGTSNGAATGTMLLKAERVFNTQPTALSALFSQMGVTPRPGASYTIAVDAGGATLTATTVTFAR